MRSTKRWQRHLLDVIVLAKHHGFRLSEKLIQR